MSNLSSFTFCTVWLCSGEIKLLTVRKLHLFLFCVVASSAANASLVTFDYEGFITRTEFPGVVVGDRLHGSYTFDSTATDSQPSKSVAAYHFTSPETVMTLNYGSVKLRSDDFSILVLDSSTSVDIYRAQMSINGILYSLSFIAVDPDVIRSRDLLGSPPDIASFTQSSFSVNNDNDVINLTTRGSITAITVVPTPHSILILLSGMFLMFAVRDVRW